MTLEDRKERRIQRVRNTIMDAAINVMTEQGFGQVTTKEIAKAADIAEGTLYNYFKNKDEIIMSVAKRYIENKRQVEISTEVASIEEFLNSLYGATPQNRTESQIKERTLLRTLLPHFLTDPSLSKLYYTQIVRPHLDMLESKLTILQKKGLIIESDAIALSRLVYSSFIGFAILDIHGDPEIKNASTDFAKVISDVYINVLSTGMKKEM